MVCDRCRQRKEQLAGLRRDLAQLERLCGMETDRADRAERLASKRESAAIAAHAMLVERNHYDQINNELGRMVEYERQRAQMFERERQGVVDVLRSIQHVSPLAVPTDAFPLQCPVCWQTRPNHLDECKLYAALRSIPTTEETVQVKICEDEAQPCVVCGDLSVNEDGLCHREACRREVEEFGKPSEVHHGRT